MNVRRFQAAARYLGFASPPWRWALSRARCPLCGPALFLSLKASPHMTRCLSCRATVTTLSLIPVIERHCRGELTDQAAIDPASLSAYELSTYGSTMAFLRARFGAVTGSEYLPGGDLGAVYDGVLNQDVQNLTFAAASFDLVTSNQVFEHVPDDLRAYEECARVLRPGGALVFSVPLYETAATIRIARRDRGDIVWLGAPEYHDSRSAGAKSAPVFWRHSRSDICTRVASAGFRDVRLVDVTVAPCQRAPATVVYAAK